MRTELEHPEGGNRSLSTARCEKRSVRRPEVRVGKALDPLLQEAFFPGDEPPEVLKDHGEFATDAEQATLLAPVREAKDFLDDRSHPGGYNIGEAAGARAAELSRRSASVTGVVRSSGTIASLSPIILQSSPNPRLTISMDQ